MEKNFSIVKKYIFFVSLLTVCNKCVIFLVQGFLSKYILSYLILSYLILSYLILGLSGLILLWGVRLVVGTM